MSVLSKDPNEIIDSVGIEMEFMSINRSDRAFQANLRDSLIGYRTEHDASCETPIQTFLNYPIILKDKKAVKRLAPFLSRITVGGEIISPIRNSNSPHWVGEIENLCQLLIEHGETESTVRDSFHVHINITKDVPLFVLKNILQFATSFEAFLFRLGGMGRMNRGIDNDYIFSRPYLGNGPPVVFLNRKNYPILNPADLIEAKDKVDFFNKYGDAYFLHTRIRKYITSRYMSINFCPVLTQGSLEIRTANKTLNPRYIIAWTNFCKAIVSKSFSQRKIVLDRFYPLYENRDISINEFIDNIAILDLDNDTVNILSEIWETSPVPLFDNVWRYSHLPDPTMFNNEYRTEPIDPKIKVENPRVVDFHVMEDQLDNPNRENRNFRVIQPDMALGDILINNRAIRVENNAEIPLNGVFSEIDMNRVFVTLTEITTDERIAYLMNSEEILNTRIIARITFYNFSIPDFWVKITKNQLTQLTITYWLKEPNIMHEVTVPILIEGVLSLRTMYNNLMEEIENE